MNHDVHRHLVAGVVCLALAWIQPATAQQARIAIGQEFIYPSGFDQPTSGAGGVTTAIPREFKTRTLGASLTIVDCTVSPPVSQAAWANALNQQKAVTSNTDLMIAAVTGDAGTAQKLLDAGADVNARNRHGSTALMGAAAGGYTDIVAALVAKKANVNAQSDTGATALIFAARNGHLGAVQTLLNSGAKVSATDAKGQTALACAKTAGHQPVVEVLAAAGAK